MPDPPVRPVAMSLLPLTLFTLVMAATLVSSAPMHEHLTQLEEYYGGSSETGCYYNFLHYEEGDRIITNEPCLNCTCHNRMLMCYLRVCPFTKAIGQDCTIEKKPDQCCPVITCPEVPVHLLTSSTTAITPPAPTGSTALGMPDNYGCSINEYFYTDGAQVPGDPSKPCELCYCIRNKTACVMQECTLQVEGCRPVYQEGVCCPVRYDCDYQIDVTTGLPLLETTVRTTPGLLLTTTTAGPLDCFYNGEMFGDGASIRRADKPCEHCYCMRGEIVCAVQECGTPLEKEAKNCTALPPEPGKCCPQQYQCDTKIVHVNDLYLRQNRKHENTENDNTTIPFEIMSQEKETTPHVPIHDVSTSGPHNVVENLPITEATVEEGQHQEHTDQQGISDQDIESQEHLNEVDHADHETHVEEPVVAEGEIEHEIDHQQVTQGIDILSTHGVAGTTKEHRTTSEDVQPTESLEHLHVTESVPEGSSQSSEVSETTPGLAASVQESEHSTETSHNTVSASGVSHDNELHHTEGIQEISPAEPTNFGDNSGHVSDQTTEPVQAEHQTTSPGEGLASGSESTDTVPDKPDDIVHFPGSESVDSVTLSGMEMTTLQGEKVSEIVVLPVDNEVSIPESTTTGPSHGPSMDTSSSGPSAVESESLTEVEQGTTVVNDLEVTTQTVAEVHPVKPAEGEQTTDTDVENNPNEAVEHESNEQTPTKVPISEGEKPNEAVEHEIDEHVPTEEPISEGEKPSEAVEHETDEHAPTEEPISEGEKPSEAVEHETDEHAPTEQPISEGEKPSEAVEHETDEHAPTEVPISEGEKPSEPVEHETVEHATTEVPINEDEKPSEPVEHETVEHAPTEVPISEGEKPSEPVEHETDEHTPTEVPISEEEKPSEPVEHETVEHAPTEVPISEGEKPSEPVEHEISEHAPTEVLINEGEKPSEAVEHEIDEHAPTEVPISEGDKPSEAVEHETDEHAPTEVPITEGEKPSEPVEHEINEHAPTEVPISEGEKPSEAVEHETDEHAPTEVPISEGEKPSEPVEHEINEHAPTEVPISEGEKPSEAVEHETDEHAPTEVPISEGEKPSEPVEHETDEHAPTEVPISEGEKPSEPVEHETDEHAPTEVPISEGEKPSEPVEHETVEHAPTELPISEGEKPSEAVEHETDEHTPTVVPISEGGKPSEAAEHETSEHASTDNSHITTENPQQPIEETLTTTANELLHHPSMESEQSATEESDNHITSEQSTENVNNVHEVPSTSEAITVSHPVEAVEAVGGDELHKPENIVTTAVDMETVTEQILEGGLITTIKENLVASGPVSDNQVIEEESSKKPEPGVEETNVITDESQKEVTTTAGSVPVHPDGISQDVEHMDHTEQSVPHTNPDDGAEGPIHHVTSEINGKPTEITATSSEDMSHKPTPQVPAQEPEAVTSETLVPSSPSVSEIQTEAPGPVPDSDNLLSGGHESTGGFISELSTDMIGSGPVGIELTTAEHGLIPGEGSCLVDGKTYANNSDVPPAGKCHLSCRCVSSIVHCESISCPPPPPYFTNCMPIHLAEGSCCPTYTCDGDNKVTLESDSHLAGTDSPIGETKHPSDNTATEQGTLKPEHVEVASTAEPYPVQTEERPESPIQPSGSDDNETDQIQVEQKPELPVLPVENESETSDDKETEHTNVQAPIEDKTDAPVTQHEEKPVESSEKEPEQIIEHLPENGEGIPPGGTVIPTIEPVESDQQTDKPPTPSVTGSEDMVKPSAEPVEHEVEGSGHEEHVPTAILQDIHSTSKQPEEFDHHVTSTPGTPLEQGSHTPGDMAFLSETSFPGEPVSHDDEQMVHTTPRQPVEGPHTQENIDTIEHSTPKPELSVDNLTTTEESEIKPTSSPIESDEHPTENNQEAVEHEISTEQQESHSSETTHEGPAEPAVEQTTISEEEKPNKPINPVDQTTTSSIDENNEAISQVTESHSSNESENKPHEEPVTTEGTDNQVSITEANPIVPVQEETETGNEMQHGGQDINPPESDTQQTAAPPSEEGNAQTNKPEDIPEQQTFGPSEDVTEHEATISQGETGDEQAVISPEENEEQQTVRPLIEGEIHPTSEPDEKEDHTVGSVDEAPASSAGQEEGSPAPVESNTSPVTSIESETVHVVTTTVASYVSENDVEHGDVTEIPSETHSESSVVTSNEKEPVVAVSSTESDENQNIPTEQPHEAVDSSSPVPIETEHHTEHEEQTSDNILESDEMIPVSPAQEQDVLSAHPEDTTDIVVQPEETTDIVVSPVESEAEHSTKVPSTQELVTEVDKTPQEVSSEGEQPIVIPSETEGSTQSPEIHVSEVEGGTQLTTSTEKVESAQPQEPESQTENEKEQQGATTATLPEESADNEIEKETVSDEIVQHATVPTVDVTSKETIESEQPEEISIVTVMPEKEHSVPAIESMLGESDEIISSPQAPHGIESTTLPESSSDVTDSPQQVDVVHPDHTISEEHSPASPPVEPVIVHEDVTTQIAEDSSSEKPNPSTEKDSIDAVQEEIKPTVEVTEIDEHQTVAPVETDNQVDTQTETHVDLSPASEVPSQFETIQTDKPIYSEITTTEVPTSSQQGETFPVQEPVETEIDDNQQTIHHEGDETVSQKPTSESTSEASSEQSVNLTESTDITTESNNSDQQEEIPEANIPPDSGEKLPQEPIEEDTGKPSEIQSTAQPEFPPNYSETTENPLEQNPISSVASESNQESTEGSILPGQHETVSESHTEKQPILSEEEPHKPIEDTHITSEPPGITNENIVTTDHASGGEHDSDQVTETIHTSSKATLEPDSLVTEQINETHSIGSVSPTQPAEPTEPSHTGHDSNEHKESTFNTPAPTDEKLSTNVGHDYSTSKDSPTPASSTELPPVTEHNITTSSQGPIMDSESHTAHTTISPAHEQFTEGHAPIPGEGIEHVTEGTKKPSHHFTTRPPVTEEHHRPGSEEQFEQFPTGDGDYQAPTSGETDFGDEDQASFGSGTCRYGGKMYVSAQQIPRDDPCDFCFCFRSDIICLQQSCPPPIHGCHEEPIQGFCCPRYECPVSMAMVLNTTTTTTTTTTALPPHFLPHVYKGSVQRTGCQVQGQAYQVGEIVHSASGPCLQCRCGGNGQMDCNPKECSPEPMLRKMIMAAASRRR